MSKAAGARKPNGSQKGKGPLEHEGGKRFFTTQNAKTTFWEEIKRDVALDKALKCFGKAVLLVFGGSGWVPAGERMLRSDVGTGSPKFFSGSRSGRAFGPMWIGGTACVCAQSPCIGMCQGSTGRMVSSFSSEERADGPCRFDRTRALHLSRNSESMCLDRFADDG